MSGGCCGTPDWRWQGATKTRSPTAASATQIKKHRSRRAGEYKSEKRLVGSVCNR